MPGRAVIIDMRASAPAIGPDTRILELAALELVDGKPTGKGMHLLFNPGRKLDPGRLSTFGLAQAQLDSQPDFAAQADELLKFIGQDTLVGIDTGGLVRLLDHELARAGRKALANPVDCVRARWQALHPGWRDDGPSICQYYGIDPAQLLAQLQRQLQGVPGGTTLMAGQMIATLWPHLVAEGEAASARAPRRPAAGKSPKR